MGTASCMQPLLVSLKNGPPSPVERKQLSQASRVGFHLRSSDGSQQTCLGLLSLEMDKHRAGLDSILTWALGVMSIVSKVCVAIYMHGGNIILDYSSNWSLWHWLWINKPTHNSIYLFLALEGVPIFYLFHELWCWWSGAIPALLAVVFGLLDLMRSKGFLSGVWGIYSIPPSFFEALGLVPVITKQRLD